MIKELTNNDVQDVSLHIMKHIHEFCAANNIKYTLYGGSLIGAIRHNGFIPWDDDVDIAMPRPDYDRFLDLYKDSDEFKLFAPERHNSTKLYARLCEMKRTEAQVKLPWFTGNAGLWIDIFPIDGVASPKEVFEKDIDQLKKVERLSFFLRGKNRKITSDTSAILFSKIIIQRLVGVFVNLDRTILKHTAMMKKYSYDKAEYCGQLGFLLWNYKEHLIKNWFESFELHEFAGEKFYIIKDYDKVLRHYYGDYMQLPPEEKRVPGHSDVQRFYWK